MTRARSVWSMVAGVFFAWVAACGGKSVIHADAEPRGGSGGGEPPGGSGSEGPRGGSGSGGQAVLGKPCQSDFDCLSASTTNVARCSSSGRCELGRNKPVPAVGCYTEESLPSLPPQDSRVYRSPFCESEICLQRHAEIDPTNTTCTTACATDADCAEPFTFTPWCENSRLYDPDTGETNTMVRVCMPKRPW